MKAESKHHQPEPLAIVGVACRLPGDNNSPQKLWDYLKKGEVASRIVPDNRFNFKGHFDKSRKPKTMRQDGGMFLGYVDPADFDAGFFEINAAEATSMDPNQRQMLEVVFESLENSGIPLESLDNKSIGCFVASFTNDYLDMLNRDPEDRASHTPTGNGRAILANRLSHFLNIKGPSVAIDTACSGSLQALDIAVRYIQNGDIDGAIVATSNLYMNPEHVIDTGSMGSAHSAVGLCHTFDVAADGYVKAEAVSAIVLKRLKDAVRDHDPIRAVVLGTASTSNGRTAGIASPSSEAQAMAIRAAYANAGITDFNTTTYLECHGTGTQAGDPTEVNGVGSVFAETRPADKPLLIGSVKSNIGHSEPAAGISGLLKAILSLEHGWIPGTPTFINPNPKIDFVGNKVQAFRHGIPWPKNAPMRASINSFGYGGSNAHAVIELPSAANRDHHVSSYMASDDGMALTGADAARPSVLVLSANDTHALKAGVESLGRHLINPRVEVDLSDLAYTLSERRTRLWYRAFITTRNTEAAEKSDSWNLGKRSSNAPTFGFVFTGQGAQWPQMGKDLLQYFPWTRNILEELDGVLQSLPNPPSWSLISELTEPRTAHHLRQPEFSQPLVTALQLCIIAVLESWGIKPRSTVGHSSGEIAAAYSAGLLDRAGAITAAFYRGRAAVNRKREVDSDVGMLAVGLGADEASKFLEKHAGKAWIACFNSPSSVTVSGKTAALEALREELAACGQFARILQVDLAYHSELMGVIADEYEDLLAAADKFHPLDSVAAGEGGVNMFSSVTASKKTASADAPYWKANMVSAVRFGEALKAMLEDDGSPNFLIEIGPSGALAGPVSQVLKSLPATVGGDIAYLSSWARGVDAGKHLFDAAGYLWVAGAPIDMAVVNNYSGKERTIIDLPNYKWNHSVKYWHENPSSKDWRFRKYRVHDLLGSKILGTSWRAPTWRRKLNVADVPYLLDHRMGGDAIMPGAGYITMALEAMYQKHCALLPTEVEAADLPARNDLCYRFRDVRFRRALVLEDGKEVAITFTLAPVSGSDDWHEFRVWTTDGDVVSEHCSGRVRVHDAIDDPVQGDDALPIKYSQSPDLWYKYHTEVGVEFGPTFKRITDVEAVPGHRSCRTMVTMEPEKAKHSPQSYYPIHPAALDGCLQTVLPSNVACDRTNKEEVFIPCLIDDFIINKVPTTLKKGLAKGITSYSGKGRPDQEQNWVADTSVYDADSGQLAVRITGMRYVKLDMAPKPDPHTFHSVVWKPDIELLQQNQVACLTLDKVPNRLDAIIDLIAFKKPTLRVLEAHIGDTGDGSCIWLGGGDRSFRAAYARFDFGSSNPSTVVSLEEQYKDNRNTGFHPINPNNVADGLPTDAAYDLAIIKASGKSADDAVASLKPLLSDDAFTILVRVGDEPPSGRTESVYSADSIEQHDQTSGASASASTPITPATPSKFGADSPTSSFSSAAWDDEAAKAFAEQCTHGSGSLLEMVVEVDSLEHVSLLRSTGASGEQSSLDSHKQLIVVRLAESTPEALTGLPPSLHANLKAAGWSITHQTYPFSKPIDADAVVLVLDEMSAPVMKQATKEQWEAIKGLATSGSPLLWVTQGAQHPVTHPDNAMIQGLFRVARMEDPSAKLATLDVQSSTSPATDWAILKVLGALRSATSVNVETEYKERNGMLHIQRVMPDAEVNSFRSAEKTGLEPVVKPFHGSDVQVSLRPERLGTLQSMVWCETELEAPAVPAGCIEVEVMAVGVNFKDAAITMGIVSDNEYNIGFEGSGVVRRLGPGVTNFKVGDRACMLMVGCYSNRVRVPAGRCHAIPDWMSFEQGATIPSVYSCSIYAMYHLGNLQEGQSVLIHSATGGIGIACMELAQYKKAKIYATAGTEEKRAFLEDNYGIPRSRMFSSRNTDFAQGIMRETGGRGVDLIINSLAGELLDASWRIVAEGGTMVEIGKKDIIDRNGLSMEPFDRNCSFRALDMSATNINTEAVSARLFDELFDLIDRGHVKPIHPITTFGLDNIPAALALIQSGKHMGKIVVPTAGKEDIKLPIRPAIRVPQLSPDASYVIVGGMKGACGTLAIHMAKHGARNIIVCSRSGIRDTASDWVVESCKYYGCAVHEARGDIGNYGFVRELFRSANPKIAGIIQGAMVLRDKPLETMTHEDYHTAIHAKVQGTWNLHRASQAESRPLEFFTMLSSTAGIVGNKGQANYAAANTFLDAFASYRKGLGLRANTLDLGVITDVGYVAEDADLEARFDGRQWTMINERMLRKILSYSILQQDARSPLSLADSSTQMITGIGYPLPQNSELANDSRFRYLFNSRAGGNNRPDDDGGSSDEIGQALKQFRHAHKAGAETAVLQRACLQVVSAQIVKLMRLESEIEPGRPLSTYGLDSLGAVELRNWIRWTFGVELSTLDIANARSLIHLSEKMVSKLPQPGAVKEA